MRLGENVLVAAIAALVYGATLSENLGAAHDGAAYLARIDARAGLLHPHHLLYAPAARLWLDALGAVGLEGDSARGVAALNALCGTATLVLLFDLFRRRLGLPRAVAGAATAIPAFSFGFWFYSVCVEAYLLPLPFLVAAFHRLSAPIGPRGARLTGLLHGVAVLCHQMHVLFFVAVVFAMLQGAVRAEGLRRLLDHALVLGGVVGLGYLGAVVGVLGIWQPVAILEYVAAYGLGDEFWQAPSVTTGALVGIGAGRAWIGGHFVFAIPGVADLLAGLLPGQELGDERWLVRELPAVLALGLTGVALAAGLGLVALFLRAARRVGRTAGPNRRMAWLALALAAPYAAFFSVWVPHNVEFWIVQSLALSVFIAAGSGIETATPGSTPSRWQRRAIELGVVGALLAGVNYTGSVHWLRDRTHDYHYALVAPLAERAAPEDLVVVGRAWILAEYARRHSRAPVWVLADEFEPPADVPDAGRRTRERLERVLAAGGRVLVSGEAVTLDPNTRALLGPVAEQEIARLWHEYRPQWQRIDAEAGPSFVLSRTARAERPS